MSIETALPIGALLAAIGTLFTLLVRSQDKRAEDALDRAKTAESNEKEAREAESAARDREVQAWKDAAHLLDAHGTRLATMTQALIDQRRSTSDRT